MSYRDVGSNRRLFPSGVRGEETGFYLPLQPVFSPSKWPVEPDLHPAPALLLLDATASANPLAVAVLREPRPFPGSRPPPTPCGPLSRRRNWPGATKRQLQGSVGARGEHAQPPWVGGLCQSFCLDRAAKCASGGGGRCAFPRLHPDSAFSKSSHDTGHAIPTSQLCHGFTCDPEWTVTVCARICPIAR